MQKWEYCIITGVATDAKGRFGGLNPKLYLFLLDGLEEKEDLGDDTAFQRPPDWKKVSEAGYIAYKIAKLGIEGWEMVGTSIESYTKRGVAHCIYFRRPIE
jgi:hypothetical protein